VTELFNSVDVAGELRRVLPPQTEGLAGPATAALHEFANREAPRLLASPVVQQAWRNANRAAHKQLLRVLKGGGAVVSTDNGQVVLNLRQLIDQLAAQLGIGEQVQAAQSKLSGGAGATARSAVETKTDITLPPSTGKIVILRSDQLSTAQDIADGIRTLAWVLTIVTLALLVAAVALAAGWRRIALRRSGACLIGLGVVVLLARRVIGNRVVDDLVSAQSVEAAAHAAWTIGTSLLYEIAVAMVVYGVVVVIAAWLAGPTAFAVAVRRALAPSLRHQPGLVYAGVAMAYLLVLLWGPTAATRRPIGILVLAALLALGVEALRRQTKREFPDVRRGETMDRVRERSAAVREWTSGVAANAAAGAKRLSSRSDPRPGSGGSVDDLERLSALHDRGALTDEEFATQKQLVLKGSGAG
jgi:hypothetical protein